MITIWGGYVAAGDARNARRTFYRVGDGRVVVHEVRLGRRRCGITYDQAPVYVFGDLDQACMHLAVNPLHVAQTRSDATLPGVEARTLTLEEWARGVGTY